MPAWDAIVVGGGHNGLVAAGYLARAGWRVLVLERLAQSGGAAVSAVPFTGRSERLSRYAYLMGPFPERILRDLGVRVELRARPVAAHRFGTELRRLFPTLLEPLPDRSTVRELLGPDAWRAFVERPLGEALRESVDDGLVRGAVSTDALIGTFTHVDDLSLRQNRCFLWHVVGGPWRVPVGGMGALSGALRDAALAAGAEVRCGAQVTGIDGTAVTWRAEGVEQTAGTRFVLGAVAPAELARLRGADPPPSAEGSQTKVNLVLERLPRLRDGRAAAEAFGDTFHLNEHEDQLASAYRDASAGRLPASAPADVYCHTLTDASIAPSGAHTLTIFGLHTPARLFRHDNAAAAATMRDRYLDALDGHLAEPIRDCLARDAAGEPCIEVKTPIDIERELRMPGGNIFHGDLDWPWAEDPAEVGRWGVETDDPRIVICGAGARRGGCVSGIGGHNAAMALLSR
jgi:phytoene dehydrogenase-like protein